MVQVRYFAGARQAAGVEEERMTLSAPMPLAGLLDQLISERGGSQSELAQTLPKCGFLVNEIAVTDLRRLVGDGDVLDVLPPFAGG